MKPLESNWLPRVTLVLGLVLFGYFSSRYSLKKPLWLDESYGLSSLRPVPTGHLITHGLDGQGSPAPLYFLILRAADRCHETFDDWHIPETIYWRWTSLVPLMIALVLFVSLRPSDFPLPWVVIGVWVFWLARLTFAYSAEARPYGLWLGESLLWLVGCRVLYDEWGWFVLSIALGATVNVAFFQIGATAAAIVAAHLYFKHPIARPGRLAALFGTGMALSMYYASLTGKFGYTSEWAGTWPMFFRFLLSYKWTVLASLYWVYLSREEKRPEVTALALTICFWFMMSPLIYYLTRLRGNFFTERQYIYWVASLTLLLLELTRYLFKHNRTWSDLRRPQTLFLIALILLTLRRLDPHKTLQWLANL